MTSKKHYSHFLYGEVETSSEGTSSGSGSDLSPRECVTEGRRRVSRLQRAAALAARGRLRLVTGCDSPSSSIPRSAVLKRVSFNVGVESGAMSEISSDHLKADQWSPDSAAATDSGEAGMACGMLGTASSADAVGTTPAAEPALTVGAAVPRGMAWSRGAERLESRGCRDPSLAGVAQIVSSASCAQRQTCIGKCCFRQEAQDVSHASTTDLSLRV
mmetsp:Transcript_63294/g.150976  ORF Transcript_63294/g.150976 Transcript_63294/m.150976 type:complete len:216 (-) Transcript_63294:147-794(-)|eukprot:CAMPEP_0178395098 /NCGR_PEP_ID=MMETSP0689_2-20121128/13045_1 /TAXON_ID=160604 /ORGANISM="Amphidinium massartii, Strain CS-259" /LENGTH=215 /DNA_ID=CAMNT_0020015745 /DNA_START=39 /DNA_END=686 /DNA_ORIENTATION=-